MAKRRDAPLSHYLKEEVPVCITYNEGTLRVVPDVVTVWRTKKERVHWFLCGAATIAAIEFGARAGHRQEPESPFDGPIMFHPERKHALSGAVLKTIRKRSKHFKYSVTILPTGRRDAITLDPEVNVMP